MRLSGNKIRIIMANQLIDTFELIRIASINYATFKRAINGEEVKTSTAGKIAKALNVKVEEILED